MKASGRILVVALVTLVTAVLFSIPVSMLFTSESKAAVEGSQIANINGVSTDALDESYIFVVLEDEEVPLAAAPTQQAITLDRTSYFYISLMLLAVMITCAYTSWYYMTINSIKKYSDLIAGSELKKILPSKSFMHPFVLACADKEIQSMAADKFF